MKNKLEDLTPISEDEAIKEMVTHGQTICLMRASESYVYYSIKDFTDFFIEKDKK